MLDTLADCTRRNIFAIVIYEVRKEYGEVRWKSAAEVLAEERNSDLSVLSRLAPHFHIAAITDTSQLTMRWPAIWSTKDDQSKDKPLDQQAKDVLHDAQKSAQSTVEAVKKQASGVLQGHVSATTWSSYTQPQTLIATVVLTSSIVGFYRFYRTFLKRIPIAATIKPGYFRKRSILGKVTSVGDGDNFRIYHTPGGWLAGWGWLPWRRVPTEKKALKDQTIHVRIAGVDAPELAHFGRPSQPYGQEALEWLTAYVSGRRVRAYVYRADQYQRVVATAYVWKGFLRRDVGLQMIRAGLATIYEAKTGAEFGEGLEDKYKKAMWWAQTKRKGMWAHGSRNVESPREYKTKHNMGAPADGNEKS
jgi:endonuclease YncB( thermonuclease family)